MTGVNTTSEIAVEFSLYWNKKGIDRKPSLLISGYNDGKPSVLELRADRSTFEHFQDETSFGITYHGEQAVADALIGLGDFEFPFSDCKGNRVLLYNDNYNDKDSVISE